MGSIIIIIIIILIIAFIIIDTFYVKKCFIHKDYELNYGKYCYDENCIDKDTCQLYQNYLNKQEEKNYAE